MVSKVKLVKKDFTNFLFGVSIRRARAYCCVACINQPTGLVIGISHEAGNPT